STSKSDVQEEEKGSEPSGTEDRPEGRVTRKGRQASQKSAASKDASKILSKESKSKDQSSEPSAEDGELEEVKETRARRGRPPKSASGKVQKEDRRGNVSADSGPRAESDEEGE
ncbi:hypothetical protein Z043_117748, partial [Scleropages formosus]